MTVCKLTAYQKLWRVLDVLAAQGTAPTYVIRNWMCFRKKDVYF